VEFLHDVGVSDFDDYIAFDVFQFGLVDLPDYSTRKCFFLYVLDAFEKTVFYEDFQGAPEAVHGSGVPQMLDFLDHSWGNQIRTVRQILRTFYLNYILVYWVLKL
jgi:hypothetical protein